MASRTLMIFLAFCACVAMASLPSAAAASGNRKMLDVPDINVAVAEARARAAAASDSFNQRPRYVGRNNDDDDDEDDDDNCRRGGCNQRRPSYSSCQSAASAYASGTAVSRGNDGDAFSNAKAFADARSTAFGSDDWKNKFINACSSTAYAEATSVAGSGK